MQYIVLFIRKYSAIFCSVKIITLVTLVTNSIFLYAFTLFYNYTDLGQHKIFTQLIETIPLQSAR
ncbi:hypothetical protein GCM10027423_08490 [Spirosoma arcticum]